MSLIESQDLLGFLTGTTPTPAKTRTAEAGEAVGRNPKYTSWVRTNRLVKSWIVGSLSEEVIGHAVGLETAANVWEALTTHFKQSSTAREFDLLAQLQLIRKDTKSLSTYLRDFKSICDQLHAIRKPVADATKVFRLLEGLDHSYKAFKTTMLRPPVPSYVEIVPQLQSYELRLRCTLTTPSDPSVDFFSQNTSRGNRGYRRGNRGRNSQGGRNSSNRQGEQRQQDHSNQQRQGYDSRSSSRGSNSLTCQICKRAGHDALRCHYRFDNSYQSDHMPKALAALHLSDSNDDEWHPDTGATTHITHDQGLDDTQDNHDGQ